MTERFLAVVNPAAGGGRCGQLARQALERLRRAGVALEIVQTRRVGDGTTLVREGYARGFRRFLAVGGDGTAFEIVNGLFPPAGKPGDIPTLAFLPLGTGNSFLRDFTSEGAPYAMQALVANRSRPCDVVRLTHAAGAVHYINLFSLGFTADVASLTNRRFKGLGELGYLLGVLLCLLRLRRRSIPIRVDGEVQWDIRRCLFLTFNNSKFTGGKMMIAPQAESGDGWIEFVRWGPIGRLGLIRNLHTLYDGSHVKHPLASRRAVKRVEFRLDEPIDVMIDGEVLRLDCRCLEILAGALHVMV